MAEAGAAAFPKPWTVPSTHWNAEQAAKLSALARHLEGRAEPVWVRIDLDEFNRRPWIDPQAVPARPYHAVLMA